MPASGFRRSIHDFGLPEAVMHQPLREPVLPRRKCHPLGVRLWGVLRLGRSSVRVRDRRRCEPFLVSSARSSRSHRQSHSRRRSCSRRGRHKALRRDLNRFWRDEAPAASRAISGSVCVRRSRRLEPSGSLSYLPTRHGRHILILDCSARGEFLPWTWWGWSVSMTLAVVLIDVPIGARMGNTRNLLLAAGCTVC